ncbi:MAG TPA: ATP-binding protein [Acidimicrobiia bacterium]|nr:ATP-binding protein [Acidimicrobiia bacterium]
MAQRQDQGPDFELRVRAEAEQLQHARHALQTWLGGHGTGPEVGAEIALAAHEAAANVVEHAYRGRAGELVLRARADDGQVTVVVEDEGDWRAPSRTDQRGRGLALMHGLMDDVTITAMEAGSGTRVTLRRRIGHR